MAPATTRSSNDPTTDPSMAAFPTCRACVADGGTKKEVVDRLFREARECLRNLILTGAPVPLSRLPEEWPAVPQAAWSRLLLVIM